MPNSKYNAGRKWEYAVRKLWSDHGYEAIRTAGSHGFADVIAVKHGEPVHFIQCKRTEDKAQAKRLAAKFKESSTFPRNEHFNQWLYIKVKGTPAHDFIKVLV